MLLWEQLVSCWPTFSTNLRAARAAVVLTLHIQAKAKPAESVALEIGSREDKKAFWVWYGFWMCRHGRAGIKRANFQNWLLCLAFPVRCGFCSPNRATLCLISEVHLCPKQVVLVQGGSPYLHGRCGHRTKSTTLYQHFLSCQENQNTKEKGCAYDKSRDARFSSLSLTAFQPLEIICRGCKLA